MCRVVNEYCWTKQTACTMDCNVKCRCAWFDSAMVDGRRQLPQNVMARVDTFDIFRSLAAHFSSFFTPTRRRKQASKAKKDLYKATTPVNPFTLCHIRCYCRVASQNEKRLQNRRKAAREKWQRLRLFLLAKKTLKDRLALESWATQTTPWLLKQNHQL